MVTSALHVRTTVGLIAALIAVSALPSLVAFDATIAAAATAETPTPTRPTQRLRGSRSRRSVQRFPAEYRRIQSRSAITRAELAVVLSVGLDNMLERAASDQVVILTDTRDHWADRWIQTAVRTGVMDASKTHRFEPDQFLQRRELAETIAAVIALATEWNPSLARQVRTRATRFSDMEPTHVSYQAAATAVSAGVLDLGRGGFFHPTELVSGEDAVDVVRRLERLVRG